MQIYKMWAEKSTGPLVEGFLGALLDFWQRALPVEHQVFAGIISKGINQAGA